MSPIRRWLQHRGWWVRLVLTYLNANVRFWRWRLQLWLNHDLLRESTQTSMKQTLLFIRHGQTTWNVEHRLPGQLAGVALNDNGRQQAARLAEALRVIPLSAIISSPLERAYNTAAFVAEGRDLIIQTEPDLMDTNVGAWAGQRIDDLNKTDPAWKEFVKNPASAPEGVETFPQVQQRVVAAVERWRQQDNIGPYVAFVAHADVVKLLIAHYSGLDPLRAGAIFIDNASASLIEIEAEHQPHVLAIGWTPQPGWLKPPAPVADELKNAQATQEVGEKSV